MKNIVITGASILYYITYKPKVIKEKVNVYPLCHYWLFALRSCGEFYLLVETSRQS